MQKMSRWKAVVVVLCSLLTASVHAQIRGYVDGTFPDGSGGFFVRGWACQAGHAPSINVHVYVGGAVGSGTYVGAATANLASEAAVATACQTTGAAYRYMFPLTSTVRQTHGGKSIHVHGLSPLGTGNLTLTNSGAYLVPRPLAAIRRYTYNANQELCKVNEPETGVSVMAYDGAGNLAWSAGSLALTSHNSCNEGSVPAAAKTVRTYDARNRLATLAFPDGQGSQALTYTPDGLQASITTENDAGELQRTTNSYSYNRRRFLTREILQFGSVFTWPVYYAYNVNGHLSSLSWHGLDVNYAPNALGQPTQAGTYATGVAYHPNGGVKEFSYGNGIKHSVTQNARGLPDTSCDFYGTCTSSAILNDGYDYDQVGNVAAISDGRTGGRGNRSMTYDSLDRLTQVVSPMFGTATYGYDTLDNLTRVKLTGGNQVRDHYYCYDGSWRLTNVKTGSCAGATVMGLGYDAQGNLANKNGRTYTFDYGNRLRSNSGSPGSSYAYDGHGRRVLDQVGTGPKYTHYLQDGRLSMTGDNRAGKVAEYVYLQGSLVAIRERDVVTNVYTTKYQHTDALGSPLAITDQSRAVLERTEYEPYGWTANRVGRDGPGYTGHVEDAATSLTYMQQRYYDPQIGLFLSVDPVTAYSNPVGQFHRYRYANNNPYKFTDPDGRIADIVLDIGFAAYSAYVLAKDPSWTNLAALGADIGAAAVPGVTGAGVAVRAGGSAADAVRAVNGVTDATRAARPADGAAMGTDEALDTASSYLGDGYKQIADGVFRSADGTRQVRMTNSDLATSKNHAGAPHMNFEEGVTTTKPSGRQVFDAEHNSHVYLSDENRR